MKNRIPTYPGRVRLTPVQGQANVFDLLRSDAPIEDGTPINKDSLLKDETALMFGLDTDAVPDDALRAIKTTTDTLGTTIVREVNRAKMTTFERFTFGRI